MRVCKVVMAFLLLGAAPAEVPEGRFQIWSSYKKTPLHFSSGGVSVHVEALPCPSQPVGDSTCAFEGYNNQAAVIVTAPGMPTFSVSTDR